MVLPYLSSCFVPQRATAADSGGSGWSHEPVMLLCLRLADCPQPCGAPCSSWQACIIAVPWTRVSNSIHPETRRVLLDHFWRKARPFVGSALQRLRRPPSFTLLDTRY
ncbi:hypothetical protein N656DRAFT_382325 [Canariomyces notabilis]|uniref:Uncharacterized protein n=1 Tax=Canariomyces notabilis TaxID=2074819 RepID=A0AAN6TJZ3_9PEZI|nr:hypothetical protein N656DRAFT_382325 [Canariomyces arenarius]